jgi:hypothetical protein
VETVDKTEKPLPVAPPGSAKPSRASGVLLWQRPEGKPGAEIETYPLTVSRPCPLVRLPFVKRLRGMWYPDLPFSDFVCSRTSDGDVCGVQLCDQHRRMVTHWAGGKEELNPRAAKVFASWGVVPIRRPRELGR